MKKFTHKKYTGAKANGSYRRIMFDIICGGNNSFSPPNLQRQNASKNLLEFMQDIPIASVERKKPKKKRKQLRRNKKKTVKFPKLGKNRFHSYARKLDAFKSINKTTLVSTSLPKIEIRGGRNFYLGGGK